jgi:hypothetical protein
LFHAGNAYHSLKSRVYTDSDADAIRGLCGINIDFGWL